MVNAGFLASIGLRAGPLGHGGVCAGLNRRLGREISPRRRGAAQWASVPGKRALLGAVRSGEARPVCPGAFSRRFYRSGRPKSAPKPAKTDQKLEALPAPPRTGYSPWVVFLREKLKQTTVRGGGFMKQCSLMWRNMPQEERQAYEDISSESKLQASRTYTNWVNSLSPGEITRENHIRRQMRRQGKKRVALIRDPRKPKRYLSPFLFFCAYARSRPDYMERYVQGRTRVAEQIKVLAEKWALMEDFEKQEFVNSSASDKERYLRELELYHKL